MADLTGSTLTIPPIGLSGLSGLTPVAFQLLTPETSTTTSATGGGSSTIVQVSGSGLLLSAVADFRDTLTTLQSGQVDGEPADALSQARSLVDAFNQLQDDIGSLQTSFNSLTGSLEVDSLALTLNQLATTAIATGSSSLASLSAIGIDVQATVSSLSGAPTLALSLDEAALTAAETANPAATQDLITQATQAFLAPLAEFDAQAAGAAITQTTSTLTELGNATTQTIDLNAVLQVNTPTALQGIGLPTDLLAQLPADSVLNNVTPTDLDLAAVGLDAETLLSNSDVLRGRLAATLQATGGTAEVAATTEDLLLAAAAGTVTPLPGATAPAIATTTQVPAAAPATVSATTGTAGIAGQTAATTIATAATTATALATDDTIAAERRTSAATLALQNLLGDATRRAIDTNLFDPAYSAVIAASHLSDFVSPAPDSRTLTPPVDIPAPVSAAMLVRAIGDYQEAARTGVGGRLR